VGEWSACPLPGHQGAATLDDPDGELRLWCDCLGGERLIPVTLRDGREITKSVGDAWPHWYPLSDAYLAVETGRVLERGFVSEYRAAWAMLLKVDVGLIRPSRVDLLVAPVSELAQRTAELFRRLYGAQLGEGWPTPGTLSMRLVGEWCGCSPSVARDAIRELEAAGIIERDGKEGRTFRYRPGRG
jgi:hypothetical protein